MPGISNFCEICDTPDLCGAGQKPCDLSGEFHGHVPAETANQMLRRIQQAENKLNGTGEGRALHAYQIVENAKITMSVGEMDELLRLAENRDSQLGDYYAHVSLLRGRAIVETDDE